MRKLVIVSVVFLCLISACDNAAKTKEEAINLYIIVNTLAIQKGQISKDDTFYRNQFFRALSFSPDSGLKVANEFKRLVGLGLKLYHPDAASSKEDLMPKMTDEERIKKLTELKKKYENKKNFSIWFDTTFNSFGFINIKISGFNPPFWKIIHKQRVCCTKNTSRRNDMIS